MCIASWQIFRRPAGRFQRPLLADHALHVNTMAPVIERMTNGDHVGVVVLVNSTTASTFPIVHAGCWYAFSNVRRVRHRHDIGLRTPTRRLRTDTDLSQRYFRCPV